MSNEKQLKGNTPTDRENECFETAITAVVAAARSIGIMADRGMILAVSRHPNIVLLRYMLMYVLRETMGVRVNIAARMAKLHHSTLIYGSRQVLHRASVEPDVATLFKATMKELDMPVPEYIMLASEKKLDLTVYKYKDRGLESWRRK